jgi:hypothetical protein
MKRVFFGNLYVTCYLKLIQDVDKKIRTREEETDPTAQCIQIRLGVKKTVSGKNNGVFRAIQGRCTSSCRTSIRRKQKHLKWVIPPTALVKLYSVASLL